MLSFFGCDVDVVPERQKCINKPQKKFLKINRIKTKEANFPEHFIEHPQQKVNFVLACLRSRRLSDPQENSFSAKVC